MFSSLEEEIEKEQGGPKGRERTLRIVGFLAIISILTIILFGTLYGVIRFLE
jgi:hypothetical protein